jgi:hypothetical protein
MSRYGEGFRLVVKNPCVPMHNFTCNQAGLKFLQLLVGGGTIEGLSVPDLKAAGIDMFFNEDGRMKEMPPNIQLGNGMMLVGPVVFIGYDAETMDSISLTDEQVELIDAWLNTCKHAQALL